MGKNIQPVLLGADMNCYSVARAFHEAYGVSSVVFGKTCLGSIRYSKFIRFRAFDPTTTDRSFVETLLSFASEQTEKQLCLIGCTDEYAEFIIRNQKILSSFYFCPYPDEPLADQLISKAGFYAMCDRYGLDYPETRVISADDDLSLLSSLPFPFPIIIKPSSSIKYWKHPFPGMKKVYTAGTAEEAEAIVRTICSSGYSDPIILQKTIAGDDSHMYVLTCYSDQSGKVKMMSLGHVLLEEHSPKAIGNHAAILTCENRALTEKIRQFLDGIGYRGFSNFDIKYDDDTDTFYLFEINLRQGRSNYYVTGSGINLAELIVKDCEGILEDGIRYAEPGRFWHAIPLPVVYRYTGSPALVREVKTIAKKRNDYTSFGYTYDLLWNPLRLAYVLIHNRRYYRKYRLFR